MKRKVTFVRVDTIRINRLGRNRRKMRKWRVPRGKHNKVRLHRAGYPVCPTVGYGSPKKGLGKINQLVPLLISNKSDLENANAKTNILIISKRLGAKKRMDIIKQAKEKGIMLFNVEEKS